ncbi:MAG: hypothetical protein KC620_05440, partial [Myxococcales bacterium]|nr:hypothetical protein [Myxococcales bacterium]
DLRASVPLAAMGLCDVEPGQGDLDLANARLIAPGDPAHSVLLARMQRRDGKGMPPLATRRIDEASAAAVQAWIEGIAACP